MAAVAEGAVQDLCEEATCSICLDYFRDPVTIACGHNFCRGCLSQCWGDSEKKKASCPQCRMTVQPKNVIPNRPLANFVEITKKLRLQSPRGAGGEGRLCGEHQEPLKLFCKDHKAPICVVCDRSKEHRNHKVVPAEEAAQEYQDQIGSCLENLRKEREQLLASKAVTEKESQDLLKKTEAERGKAVSQFRQLHQFLEDQEKLLLGQIEEVEKEIIQKSEEHLATLSRELSFLGSLMQELEEKRHQPASEFLQDIGRTLKKTEKRDKFCSSGFVPFAVKWRISEICDINPFLEDVMKKFKEWETMKEMAENTEELYIESTSIGTQCNISRTWEEWKRMKEMAENTGELYIESTSIGTQLNISGTWEDVLLSGAKKVNVTLDPDTAFPRLILTEDLKSVRWDKKYQALPEHPDRFNMSPFVLGREGFSAGRYYWDVFLGCEGQWAVGVARKSVRRKGPVTVSPGCGIWAVGNSGIFPHLDENPHKIRVFLSCLEGQVAFYNADTQEHLDTFIGAPFAGEIILPFFRVFQKGYLRILP